MIWAFRTRDDIWFICFKQHALMETAPEDNPQPDEEEMRVLESMGWGQ